MYNTCQSYRPSANIHGLRMVLGQVIGIKSGARLPTGEGALMWFLTVKLNYMNASIPISTVVNHDSNSGGYEIDME